MTGRPSTDTDALALVAALVLEDGRRWGEAAQPWQWDDMTAILDLHGPTNHFATRPRGGSKTTDLGGASLGVIVAQAPRGSRCFALAADRDQGRLLLDSMRGFAMRTPLLAGALEFSANRVALPREDVTLEVLAADASSSWGLRPYFAVIDEIAQWAETQRSLELLESIRSATVKQRARLVVITTAGDPTHFAYELREHARVDPLWRLHEVPGPVPWISREALDEQERALNPASFRRLHMNEWVESHDRLAALADLERLITHDEPLPPQPGVEYVIGVDMGIVDDLTAAAVCHLEPLEPVDQKTSAWRIVVDRVETWKGTPEQPVQLSEVGDWLLDAVSLYRSARVVLDPYQAMGTAQELRQHGVQVKEFTFSQANVGRLASTLLLAIRNGALALPRDPELVRELSGVRLKEPAPNVYRLDHDRGRHDDRAIAISLAAVTLLERAGRPGPRFRFLQ